MKLLSILFFCLLLTGYLKSKNSSPQFPAGSPPSPLLEKTNQVTLILDLGSGEISTFSAVIAKTAFEALEKVAEKQNFKIEVQEYDFGILVQSINGLKNTPEKAWFYYVNNQMADKSADKLELKDGDQVFWKYEKSSF